MPTIKTYFKRAPFYNAFVGANHDWPPSHFMPVLAFFIAVTARADAMTKKRC